MRKIWMILLVLLAIPVMHYLIYNGMVVQPSGAAALEDLSGMDLSSELAKRVPVEPLLGGVRTKPGNAAPDYNQALADGVAREVELPLIESGAAMQSCLFTSAVFPIAANPLETRIPSLSPVRNFASLMIDKAQRLENAGNIAGAERELQLLLSFGNHLESEYILVSTLVGLVTQKTAAEALQSFYKRQNQPDQASRAGEYAAEVERVRGVLKKWLDPISKLTVLDEGRRILLQLYQSEKVPNSIKAEIIFYNSIQHLFYHTGILYGPGSARCAFREELIKTQDPILKELAEKSATVMDLSFRERLQSVQTVEVIK